MEQGHDLTAALLALKDTMAQTTAAIHAFLQTSPSTQDTGQTGAALDDDSALILENALRSDDADKIDHALLICAPRLPPPLQEDLQRAVDDFDFRRAEATLRDWQANHPR